MYVQDIALPSGSDINITTTRAQEYSNRNTVKYSHSENRQGCSEQNAIQNEEVSGLSLEFILFLCAYQNDKIL